METLRENLLPPKLKTNMDEPIILPPKIIADINNATGGGKRDFHKGYQIISKYLGTSLGTEDLRYWFRKAVEINRNDPSSIANQHIRGANAAAARIDGRELTPEKQQELSDAIGRAVFKDIIRNKAVPRLQTIINTDVIATLSRMKGAKPDDVSNWAGAYRFWDVKITLNGQTKTIGEFITANKDTHEKFIAVQAGGAAQVVRSNSADTLREKGEILKEIIDPTRGPGALDRGRILKRTDENLIDPKSDIHLEKDESAFKRPKVRELQGNRDFGNLKTPPEPDGQVSIRPAPPHKAQNEDGTLVMNAPASKAKPSGLPTALTEDTAKRIQLAKPRDDKKQPQNLDIANLEVPTPEMLENNVFRKDENGKTNLTNEAKIWKKNKKLALALIKDAGREAEFEKFLSSENIA